MKTIFVFVLTVSMTSGLLAAWPFTWLNKNPKVSPETLVITSNNKSPRLLAEIIQYESKQPYLLLPAANSEDKRIFMCVPKSDAREVPIADLAMVVRQLNVKRIIVLGNESYVPESYITPLGRNTPIVRIDAEDWNRVADELGFMLNLSNLPEDYEENRAILLDDSKIYRPTSLPAPTKVVPKQEAKETKPVPAATDETKNDDNVKKNVEVVK